MEDFGDLLRGFRLRRGMNQQGLAYQLARHRMTISDWEHNKYLPQDRRTVLDIANALGLSRAETDKLLFAAEYPLEYQSKKVEQTSVAQFEEVRAEIIYVEQLKVAAGPTLPHLPTRCDFYHHISAQDPQRYIQRETELYKVRKALLSDAPTIALTSELEYARLDALHGMGGIGKSVIARALCDDSEVQARFPNGILWITVGQMPELVPKMRDWLSVLGGTITETAPTVDSLKVALAKLLKDRACLLILDDVWQSAHVEVFRVGGSSCRLLLTTRDAEVAYELGAKIQTIPVMAEGEAIALLEKWADGRLDEIDITLKRRIVKRLGYLPLAVRLAGAQLRYRSPKEWLKTFAINKLKTSRVSASNIHDSLEQTFDQSLNELTEDARHLYIALAIFKEDELIPQAGIERLWQGLSHFDADETNELLDDLVARALLEITSASEIQLHDLLRDFISEKLKDRHIEAHQALLNSYRTTWSGTGWHTADDDGYLYDHLAYHLHIRGAIDELKGLFADQQWLQKRVPQGDYTYDGYLSDLGLAWSCVDAEARQQIEVDQEPSAFADCIRYLLIRTSINSIAGNYVPELVARAVEVGIWSSRRALSLTTKIPDDAERVEMYVAILKTARLDKEELREAQRSGLEAALTIKSEGRRAEVLGMLAPQLTGEVLQQALEAAKAIADEVRRAQVLGVLVPQLMGEERVEVLERALEAATKIVNWRRAQVIRILAPQLTGAVLQQALEAAIRIEDGWMRAKLLEVLAPQLTGELLQRALEAALAIADEERRVQVLRILAPQLTEELLQRVLEVALAIKDEWRRTQALNVLLHSKVDQVQVLKSIRRNMMDYLLSIRHLPRSVVLPSLLIEGVFSTSIFLPETLGNIASYMIEVCEEWSWL